MPRIDKLRQIKASVLFLSVEPLLEDLGKVNLENINWVIVGGESGAKARPMEKEWVVNIKQQCENDDVAFFFKQWGTWGADKVKRNKKKNGKILDGKVWQQYPEIIEQQYALVYLIENRNSQCLTKAIRNLGNMLILKLVALNEISCKLKINRFKTRTTHSQTVVPNTKKKEADN